MAARVRSLVAILFFHLLVDIYNQISNILAIEGLLWQAGLRQLLHNLLHTHIAPQSTSRLWGFYYVSHSKIPSLSNSF